MGHNLTHRIGFACKLLDSTGKNIPEMNYRSTTVAWLNRQTRDVAVARLWEIMQHNVDATRAAIAHVGTFEPELRMMRIGSDMLPVYTEPNWSWFWQQSDVRKYLEQTLAPVGALARKLDVRLSMHPGQFCCIVSNNEDIVRRSIEELEYHTDIVRWMGFGKSKLDFKVNIHLSGKLGLDGFDNAHTQMSTELRNCLTLENDEYQTGIDTLISLKDKVGIVLDIHHHFIHSHEYINSNDDRIKHIIDSWQGVKPVFHYSQSREEYLRNFLTEMPCMDRLQIVAKKAKLRSHSDFYKHKILNEWAFTHLNWGDCMAESKMKNLASFELYNQLLGSI